MAFISHYFFSLALACAILRFPGTSSESNRNWHILSVDLLLPDVVCTSPRVSNSSAMTVVYRHGPCSPLAHLGGPFHVEILDQDQSRVDSIHRHVAAASRTDSVTGSKGVSVPARVGFSLGIGNYIVSIGIGTPAREFSVMFDTGSDLSWIQCKPCIHCYEQQDPLFDPTQSSTYSTISCTTPECQDLDSSSCSSDSICRYDVVYGDQSQTDGNLVRDTLTLTPSDALQDFVFGCGDDNSGLFGKADGLIGLGRKNESLASQASPKYGAIFSYCLPSVTSAMGYLALGEDAPKNVQFTQMITRPLTPSFYYVNLIGIKVAGRPLRISPYVFARAGTVIDSGTVITRLPPAAYSALRSAFSRLMTQYPSAPALSILDTCYDFTGHSTVKLPTVALVFAGGATLDVAFSGVLYVSKVSQACLAFAPNADTTSISILGNTQQKTFSVIYDVGNQKIGFGPKGCS